MRWKRPAPWIALASGLLVAWLVWLDRGSTSPGGLSRSHARVAELAGDACARCHGEGGAQGLAPACSACHTEIAAQIEGRSGFHGTLAGDAIAAERCGACHSEHHGERFPLVSAQSFALAGVPDPERYDHARLGFELAGRHAELACEACHPLARADALQAGEQRFLGRTQACAGCHADPHGGALPDCAACHGQEQPFARVALFEHTRAFPLTGAHASPACTECHPKGSAFAVEATRATSAALGRASRGCADCHASPHAPAFVAGSAGARGLTPEASCAACHSSDHRSFSDARASFSAQDHAVTGFPLDAPHDDVACAACHASDAAPPVPEAGDGFARFRDAYPGRDAADCAACHGDPHGGQFALGTFADAACTACHAPTRFAPPAFEREQHDRTAFPLTGAHEAVGCIRCHRETRVVTVRGETRPARTFHGTPSACDACHADPHGGSFGRAGLPADVEGRAGCARCHGTESFADAARGFDHARWTGFALVGAHAGAACTACHAPLAAADASGRTFGRAQERFPGDPSRCVTCHADVHAGAFDAPGLPLEVDGRTDCARCHGVDSFRAASADFDHGRWTGFALVGAHARAACASCHRRAEVAGPGGRTFGRCAVSAAAARDCASCHADVHAGAFDRAGVPAAIDGRTGCARCHEQEGFDLDTERFDHARWTGFALDGAHADVACAACHVPVAAADGGGPVFGPARGGRCADCHVDPHVAQFAVAGRTDCARCHTQATTFRALAFDHQRDTRFALDEAHRKLACSACHVPAALPDGTRAVRYKPLGTSCGDCHDPRGGRPR